MIAATEAISYEPEVSTDRLYLDGLLPTLQRPDRLLEQAIQPLLSIPRGEPQKHRAGRGLCRGSRLGHRSHGTAGAGYTEAVP